jgi:hypothetical protein
MSLSDRTGSYFDLHRQTDFRNLRLKAAATAEVTGAVCDFPSGTST